MLRAFLNLSLPSEREQEKAELLERVGQNPELVIPLLNDLLLLYNDRLPSQGNAIVPLVLSLVRTSDDGGRVVESLLSVFEDHFLVKTPFPGKAGYFYLLRELFEKGVVDAKRVVEFVRRFRKYHWNYLVSVMWLFLWFAKEIRESDVLLYDDMYAEYDSFCGMECVPRVFKYFKRTFDKYHRQYREWPMYLQELKREPDEFKDIWDEKVQNGRSVANERVQVPIFSRHWFLLSHPTRCQCAAFLGAGKWLKTFFRFCCATLKDDCGRSLAFFAAAGGMQDIFDRLSGDDKFDAAMSATVFGQFLKLDHTDIREMANKPDREGRTLLHYASMTNDIELMEHCIGKGCGLDDADVYEWTPLHLAIMDGNYAAAAFLIENGASVTKCAANGVTPLHLIVQRQRTDIFDLVAASPQFDVNVRTEWVCLLFIKKLLSIMPLSLTNLKCGID